MAKRSVEAIDEELGLWSAQLETANGWSLRTTVLRLRDGSLALVSPTRGLEDQIAELGTPSVLIAPNYFHHLGLADYRARWPKVVTVASNKAIDRFNKKGLAAGIATFDSIAELLPDHAELIEAPGLKTGELLLRVTSPAGIVWCVSDSFFNLPANPKGMMGLVCRMTGTSPGLRIGKTFTTLAVSDRKAYGAWLRAQLEADKPTVLVPAHGQVHRGPDLYQTLDAATRQRLRC